MSDESSDDFEGFGSKAVHSGTKHVGDTVNTPIFQSSTLNLQMKDMLDGQLEHITHFSMLELHQSMLKRFVINCALEEGEDAKYSHPEWQLYLLH